MSMALPFSLGFLRSAALTVGLWDILEAPTHVRSKVNHLSLVGYRRKVSVELSEV